MPVLALLLLPAAGCDPYSTLPANRAPSGPAPIPAGADCVYAWSGRSRPLMTYWGEQQLSISCRGRFPRAWRRAGDEAWEVRATNARGTPIPCLGVLRRWKDSRGREQTAVLPPFDLDRVRDGLYLLMDTKVALSGDGADPAAVPREIRPTAVLIEIRSHYVTSFQVDIPLVPETPCALTPAPELPPEEPPSGTQVPVK